MDSTSEPQGDFDYVFTTAECRERALTCSTDSRDFSAIPAAFSRGLVTARPITEPSQDPWKMEAPASLPLLGFPVILPDGQITHSYQQVNISLPLSIPLSRAPERFGRRPSN
jgi:hypothetical protein